MRNPREQARQRLNGAFEPRVLEPSPPAVGEPPWFADDPLDGGDLLPIQRGGARTWTEISSADADLRAWCEDRWLVDVPLAPLPPSFAETRRVLHDVAEQRVSPPRQQATGKIGLRFTYRGFGTPFFGDDRQVRVEDGVLIDGEEREFINGVDPLAARALGDWYGFCTRALEQLRAENPSSSRVQLWPEHFDIAIDAGPDGRRANFGGSPGDDGHAEPYLYVGPWDTSALDDPFWNEPFGASLSYTEMQNGAEALEFLRQGKELLRGD